MVTSTSSSLYGGGCLDEGYFKPVILKTGDVFLDVGASAPSHNMWESTGETIRVRMITLDSCKLAPTVLKVDTEGYEVPVLKGGLGTIDHCHPALCIETHEEGDVERVKELLEPYRYSWNVFPRVQGDGTKQQIMIGN